jgi:AAA+ superfamily predicted ATPase
MELFLHEHNDNSVYIANFDKPYAKIGDLVYQVSIDESIPDGKVGLNQLQLDSVTDPEVIPHNGRSSPCTNITLDTHVEFEDIEGYILSAGQVFLVNGIPVNVLELDGSKINTRTEITVNAQKKRVITAVGGLDKELGEINRRLLRKFNPELIEELGLIYPRGVLLHGPPGTGKTTIAKLIAESLEAKVTYITGPDLLDKFIGESERKIAELLSIQDHLKVVIIDEIDAICKERDGKNDSVVNQLLAKMDGLEITANLLVIGTTNRMSAIDRALLRPGRFEIHMEIPLPDESGRLEILKLKTAKMSLRLNADLAKIASVCVGYSGAELEGLIRNAVSKALLRDPIDPQITEADFDLPVHVESEIPGCIKMMLARKNNMILVGQSGKRIAKDITVGFEVLTPKMMLTNPYPNMERVFSGNRVFLQDVHLMKLADLIVFINEYTGFLVATSDKHIPELKGYLCSVNC